MPEPAKLLQWGYESAIPGTFESYIFALQQKYSVAKRFVTMESASERILKFLASHYKVKSASYKDLTSQDKMEDSPTYNHLAIVDPRLDAFFFNVSGSFSSQVVIFFDDPAELQKLKPSEETLEVPYGAYQLSESTNGYVLSPIATKLSERPILDQNLMGNLITDTDTFFGSRDFYFSNNITHKRGVLMIGFPGVGKTTFLKYYQSHLVDKYSIIIDCSTTYFGPGLFHYLRAVFGSKPKVLILEDVDGACGSMGSRSAFLNFLDGPRELDNTLTIATTNYPERLDDALLDRPSRFDSIYVVGLPNVSLRKEFLIKWFPELQAEPDRLEALALATDGFTGAFFKELKTLAGLRQSSCEEALKAIQDRRKLIEQFGRGIKPKWGMEDKEPPTPMSVWEAPEKMSEPEYAQAKQAFGGASSSKSTITASIMADYRIDHDLARRLVAAARERTSEEWDKEAADMQKALGDLELEKTLHSGRWTKSDQHQYQNMRDHYKMRLATADAERLHNQQTQEISRLDVGSLEKLLNELNDQLAMGGQGKEFARILYRKEAVEEYLKSKVKAPNTAKDITGKRR